MKRRVTVFTGNRAEYGLLHPLIRSLSEKKSLEVSLIISGSHLIDEFGMTVKEIDTRMVKEVKKLYTKSEAASKIDEVILTFSNILKYGSDTLSELSPDFVVIAGDRYETFALALTAFYMNYPIAHLFGGDLSQGGHLDDSARHSITKLAHLHFTTNEDSRNRVLSLGEESWRVFNVGSTAIDNIISSDYSQPENLAREFDLDPVKPIILFTQHPVTTESDLAYGQAKVSLEALKEVHEQTVITYPCDDPGSELIIKAIKEYDNIPYFRITKSLGWKKYIGMLRISSVVVGNSSSGIMETPALKVPAVNIGTRQMGRLSADNVINVTYDREEIMSAIKMAISNREFVEKVKKCSNPYGDGGASRKITEILQTIPINKALLQKKMTY